VKHYEYEAKVRGATDYQVVRCNDALAPGSTVKLGEVMYKVTHVVRSYVPATLPRIYLTQTDGKDGGDNAVS
jgi:hypothetical protein